jgi:hypothetical protein
MGGSRCAPNIDIEKILAAGPLPPSRFAPRLGHKNVDEVRSLFSGKLESILTLNIGPR